MNSRHVQGAIATSEVGTILGVHDIGI